MSKKYLISNEGNWYKANLHCHSTFSDGTMTPEQIKEEYLSEIENATTLNDINDIRNKYLSKKGKVSELMAKMKELLKTFPGLDCGTCGAPSCKALAEDIVRGFGHPDDCVFRLRENLHEIDTAEELQKVIPAPFRKKED